MFHRQTGTAVAALRFHWVALVEEAAARAEELRSDPAADDWWRLLWGYVDIRDAAAACRLALAADGIGFEAFNIVAADTLSDTPTEDLIRTHAPQVEIRSAIPGTASAFSVEKARRMLGWEPRYSWREGAR
jgi:nucleoside-diphosphate-sugar epimerase